MMNDKCTMVQSDVDREAVGENNLEGRLKAAGPEAPVRILWTQYCRIG